MSDNFCNLLKRFVRHFCASLLGTAVDTAVLWLCAHLLFSGTYFGSNILSPVISFECAIFTNFCSCFFIVWKDRISEKSLSSFFRHLAAYNASCAGAFLLKLGILQLVILATSMDVVWCNLIALCFSGLFNFLMNDQVIFRNRKMRKDACHFDSRTPATDPEAE